MCQLGRPCCRFPLFWCDTAESLCRFFLISLYSGHVRSHLSCLMLQGRANKRTNLSGKCFHMDTKSCAFLWKWWQFLSSQRHDRFMIRMPGALQSQGREGDKERGMHEERLKKAGLKYEARETVRENKRRIEVLLEGREQEERNWRCKTRAPRCELKHYAASFPLIRRCHQPLRSLPLRPASLCPLIIILSGRNANCCKDLQWHCCGMLMADSSVSWALLRIKRAFHDHSRQQGLADQSALKLRFKFAKSRHVSNVNANLIMNCIISSNNIKV